MGDRKCVTPSRKRQSKVVADEYWDCSVCTFTNSPEAFKCSICDVRKGTSTRKPRLNQHIVAQQEATRLVAQMPHSPLSSHKEDRHDEAKRPRLKSLDRSNPVTMAVTVDDVTIMFTEYKQKKPEDRTKSRDKS